ncbi:ATP-binding protein [Bifidobacterium choloepi]|uniref:ATP-binding protein n=1 Tax=Bifidobacterium choloepi TaxID=2614131 RepID=A0A6I5MZ71_9BIFI|nr:DUF4143 domain-containing protein [Bifidobacterium choloepi]NEG69948.1 ATP-binding protein [Bifidobacterium choloepi]
MEDNYLPRYADSQLEHLLGVTGAVLIRGPKWCGKTSTGERQANSVLFMQDPDGLEMRLRTAKETPSLLLTGDKPLLIDEWQMEPKLWDAVKFAIDRHSGAGQYILTGSATPSVHPAHSGVGRFSILDMRTMSLAETGESTAQVSLQALFDGGDFAGATSKLDFEDLAFIICRGGWPEAVLASSQDTALDMARQYVELLLENDISRMDGTQRNRKWMELIMKSYARTTAQPAKQTTIRLDMGDSAPSRPTLSDYLDVLNRAFVIEGLPGWEPSLRSKVAARTSPKCHFADPSIGCAVSGITPDILLKDANTFGLYFESLCVHELRVYAETFGGRVYYFRNANNLEADAVVVMPDGRWGLVEVKLGESQAEVGADSLRRVAGQVDQANMGAPSFLLVLTGGTMATVLRDDGKPDVAVVPLGALCA